MTHIKNKLKSQSGETLSEVMVGALIGVFALLLLASMIMSSSKMVTNSDAKMKQYYEAMNKIENQDSSIKTTDGKVSITYGVNDTEYNRANNEAIAVDIYGTNDPKLYSYSAK